MDDVYNKDEPEIMDFGIPEVVAFETIEPEFVAFEPAEDEEVVPVESALPQPDYPAVESGFTAFEPVPENEPMEQEQRISGFQPQPEMDVFEQQPRRGYHSRDSVLLINQAAIGILSASLMPMYDDNPQHNYVVTKLTGMVLDIG